MISRLDELLIAFFHDDMSAEEEAELHLAVESNAMAREKYERVIEDKKLYAEDAQLPLPEAKTRLRTRIMAAIILLIILFGFVGMFFVETEDALVRVVAGNAQHDGKDAFVVRDPDTLTLAPETTLHIRGQTILRSRGATIEVREQAPLAEIALISGSIEVERIAASRDAIFSLGGLELRLLKMGSHATLMQGQGVGSIRGLAGHIALQNPSHSEDALFRWGGREIRLRPSSKVEISFPENGSALINVQEGRLEATQGDETLLLDRGERTLPLPPDSE